MLSLDETIAAIATAPGGGARGIVRLSGPGVVECLDSLFKPHSGRSLAQCQTASRIAGEVQLDEDRTLPCELLLWPDDRSYTRQPVGELHTWGSPPLLERLLQSVCLGGARVAQPGEFTLRAFLAGRIDLTQAEGVLGVIDARSEGQFQAALAQLAGGLSGPLNELRDRLLDLLAHLEAGLDFVEEDIEFVTAERLSSQLGEARDAVEAVVEQMERRGQSVTDVRVVLVGAPNAGKSSLFNALMGMLAKDQTTAIVSDRAGTTRDYLEARLEIDGVRCTLVDTAGVQEVTKQGSEPQSLASAAQSMTDSQHRQAELVLLCVDGSRTQDASMESALAESGTREQIVVWTKCDLPAAVKCPPQAVPTSAASGEGISGLADAVREAVGGDGDRAAVASTAARCSDSLQRAATSLASAQRWAIELHSEELVAADLRIALEEIGQVVGAVYTDDLLDRIFSRFCIGK